MILEQQEVCKILIQWQNGRFKTERKKMGAIKNLSELA